MSDPGLSNRLRQRSRRAGLMVGLSMAATIAVCIGGFAAVYGFIGPFLSDIVPIPTQLIEATDSPDAEAVAQGPGPTEAPAVVGPAETPAPPTPTPAAPAAPTATEEAFQPDYQIRADQAVNLRPQPSSVTSANNQPTALPPSTPLEYLDEDQPTDDPNDAPRWMRFRTEEGVEGWIRQLDVIQYEDQ